MKSWVHPLLVWSVLWAIPAWGESSSRLIPFASLQHPGNVFVSGETVTIPLGEPETKPWRLLDYEDRTVLEAQPANGRVELGRLPVGFYRLEQPNRSNWVSLAVLAPFKAATPWESPIALDVAMAWFYPKERMEAASSLCALAGVNWVRDRLAWGEAEPRQGQWTRNTRYDDSARAQAQAGLRVLQVNHSSPSWATKVPKRFPPDLRDAYLFYREMARRWTNQVQAFEPWNEADITMFGGHTGSEMAALQKASYLGLKAGNPGVVACLNVFASHNRAQLADLHDNEAWPYFDTFNLHHYAPFDEYPRLYADFRAVSAGRPLWVSECALPVKWAGDRTLQEPTIADSRLLSERVLKVFACSLHEGSVATFYFLLPHYVEGQTQFGLLRRDLTPRPGYVTLAAAGRLLADAKPLGRLQSATDSVRGYLFSARPDGSSREVLVAWTTQGKTNLLLPLPPAATFDHLGRVLEVSERLSLSPAPVLAVLPEGSARRLSLLPPPSAPPHLPGTPSPVVLQALWPESKTALSRSAYRLSSLKPERVALYAYNFSDEPVHGTFKVMLPPGWEATRLPPLDLAPHVRTELPLDLDCRQAKGTNLIATVRVSGDFGPAGHAVCSMRLLPEPNLLARKSGPAVPDANVPSRWQPMVSGQGSVNIAASEEGVVVEARPQGTDKWVYPRLTLPPEARPPRGAIGLGCTLKLLEGAAEFRAIFDEENGSSYTADFLASPPVGQAIETVALFDGVAHGDGWSKPDPNQHLDLEQIVGLKIGCNSKSAAVRFTISHVRWLVP